MAYAYSYGGSGPQRSAHHLNHSLVLALDLFWPKCEWRKVSCCTMCDANSNVILDSFGSRLDLWWFDVSASDLYTNINPSNDFCYYHCDIFSNHDRDTLFLHLYIFFIIIYWIDLIIKHSLCNIINIHILTYTITDPCTY
ncbi:hypothetical protein P691DRAFT_536491 [Macrolepiota fuliginosa MF-IS2]|uniref:Uncharacterized protein n=1 Tax=Macrolepiota fuliginosa MF-IS2 TaxID=1400762 RepID=A0A9P6BXU1_9AGAR|nr:hypothetical protein P691DRAFT_536491 [Macrolepiota fuliginosa MF-IS2]